MSMSSSSPSLVAFGGVGGFVGTCCAGDSSVVETRLLSERNFSNAAISSSGMNEFISGVERVARNT